MLSVLPACGGLGRDALPFGHPSYCQAAAGRREAPNELAGDWPGDPYNPAASVKGPRHSIQRCKTPILDPTEARQILDAIDISTPIGLRDRALIGLMVYGFARMGTAGGMKVEDVFTQNRRLRLRLHEKGGKVHEMPRHHNLETYLHE